MKTKLLGSWVQACNTESVKMMIHSGFDFLVIDMEHGSIFEKDLPRLFQVFDKTNCLPIVRVAQNSPILIRRALDLGARGIVVPCVNSIEEVKKAKDAMFYPPKGGRGIGYSKANDYGLNFKKNFSKVNDELIFIIQIEHEIAVNNINEIFSISEIDYYIIGPYDLTGSLGIVGDFENKLFQDSIKVVKDAAHKHKIKSGMHVVDPNIYRLKKIINEGYDFIAYGTDALLLYHKCIEDLKKI